jgi:hypothetical protein
VLVDVNICSQEMTFELIGKYFLKVSVNVVMLERYLTVVLFNSTSQKFQRDCSVTNNTNMKTLSLYSAVILFGNEESGDKSAWLHRHSGESRIVSELNGSPVSRGSFNNV